MNTIAKESPYVRSKSRSNHGQRSSRLGVIISIVIALQWLCGIQPMQAEDGAYSLDFSAARPSSYLKLSPIFTACPATPDGTADNPITGATFSDNVESLSPGDLALGQIVVFEIKLNVNGDVQPEGGQILFRAGWNTVLTSGDDFGYDEVDGVYCAFIDTGDAFHVDPGGDASLTNVTWAWEDNENPPGPKDEIVGTFELAGLDDGDTVIIEVWVVLKDSLPDDASGNIQSRLIDAHTADGETISTGNQTVPLLKVKEFAFNFPTDYGDAPDSYGTLLASDGARHQLLVGGPYLGAFVDNEDDGLPGTLASGDDLDGTTDDEDGVTFLTALTPGSNATVQVIATTGAKLDAWVDFGTDGSFDPEDRIASNLTTVATNSLTFPVPLSSSTNAPLYARFRLSSQGGLPPDGPANDGEVEDYLIDGQIGDRVWLDGAPATANGIQDESESGLAGVTIQLYRVGPGGGLVDTQVTDGEGFYLFENVTAGIYYLRFVLIDPTHHFTTQSAGPDTKANSDPDIITGESSTFLILPGQIDLSWDAGVVITPTLVHISSFTGSAQNGVTIVEWETSQELNAVGFFLERWDETANTYVQVNETLVPADLGFTGTATYRVEDPEAATVGSIQYRLIEIDLAGRRNLYGPYTIALDDATPDEAPTDIGTAQVEPDIVSISRLDTHLTIRWQSSNGQRYAIERASAIDDTFMKISGGIPATPPENTAVLVDADEAAFYRVVQEEYR